jgi:uncharacterized protein (DUF1778 family)
MLIKARVGEDERAGFEEAARISGLRLSAWMRTTLRQEAERRLANAGKKVPWLD